MKATASCLIVAAACGLSLWSVDVPAAASLEQACATFVPKDLPHAAQVAKTEVRAATGLYPEACIVRGTIV